MASGLIAALVLAQPAESVVARWEDASGVGIPGVWVGVTELPFDRPTESCPLDSSWHAGFGARAISILASVLEGRTQSQRLEATNRRGEIETTREPGNGVLLLPIRDPRLSPALLGPHESFARITRTATVFNGRVVDSSGRAVSGARLYLISAERRSVSMARSDREGRFSARFWPAYEVLRFVIDADGFVPEARSIWLPGEESFADERAVARTIELRKPNLGFVRTVDDAPAPGAEVCLFEGQAATARVESDSAGRFTAPPSRLGHLNAQRGGFEGVAQRTERGPLIVLDRVVRDAPLVDRGAEVARDQEDSYSSADARDRRISVRVASARRGRLTLSSRGLAGTSLHVEPARSVSPPQVVRVLRDGKLTIPAPRSGPYAVTVTTKGGSVIPFALDASRGKVALRALVNDDAPRMNPEPSQPLEGEYREDQLFLRVVDAASGQGIPGARVVSVEDGARALADADLLGRVSLTLGTRSLRVIQVRALGYAPKDLTELRPDGVLELDRLVGLVGRVLATGVDWTSARVHVHSGHDWKPVGADGQFRLHRITPGPIQLEVTFAGGRWSFPMVAAAPKSNVQQVELEIPPAPGTARIQFSKVRVCDSLEVDLRDLRCVYVLTSFRLRIQKNGGPGQPSFERSIHFEDRSELPTVELVDRLPPGPWVAELSYDLEWIVGRATWDGSEGEVELTLAPPENE